jgi:hypothetical protein
VFLWNTGKKNRIFIQLKTIEISSGTQSFVISLTTPSVPNYRLFWLTILEWWQYFLNIVTVFEMLTLPPDIIVFVYKFFISCRHEIGKNFNLRWVSLLCISVFMMHDMLIELAGQWSSFLRMSQSVAGWPLMRYNSLIQKISQKGFWVG